MQNKKVETVPGFLATIVVQEMSDFVIKEKYLIEKIDNKEFCI